MTSPCGNHPHARSGFGLYIHVPFCRSRCPYCAFSSTVALDAFMPAYADAVASELRLGLTGIFVGNPDTVYLGGGTPSIMPARLIGRIFDGIDCEGISEFSVEINPESTNPSWLADMRLLGVDRVSIGIQSLDNGVLKNLGRIHDAGQARMAVKQAREAGFDNLSVDLMFGVPGQTLALWKETLKQTVDLGPDHLSCYSLSVEEDTGYFRRFNDGSLNIPSPDETADMYLYMCEFLAGEGFDRYELSNFARAGYECRHNIGYWDGKPYRGAGLSAHSYDGSRRWRNTGDIERYISLSNGNCSVIQEYEIIDASTSVFEQLMLGLRTRQGISRLLLRANAADQSELDNLIGSYMKNGLMACDGDNLILTPLGSVCADEITAEIAALLK